MNILFPVTETFVNRHNVDNAEAMLEAPGGSNLRNMLTQATRARQSLEHLCRG